MTAAAAGSVRVTIGEVRFEQDKDRHRLDWSFYLPDEKKPKRNRSATHPDKDEMHAFRADFVRMVEANKVIDRNTGLPEGLQRPRQRPTIAESACRPLWLDIRGRLHEKWNGEGYNGERKGQTVRGWANEWIALIMACLRRDAPELTRKQRQGARDFLRYELVPAEVWERLERMDEDKRAAKRAAGPKDRQQRYRWARADRERAKRAKREAEQRKHWKRFFDRYGMRWYEVDRAAVLRAIANLRLKVDGNPAAPQTVTKHTVALNETFNWAVRTGRLAANPFASLEKSERPSTTTKVKKVDQRRVPPMSLVVALISFCREIAQAGDVMAFRVLPYLALVALAGLRPSEARGLHVDELKLPERGWGLATFGQRITTPGRVFTLDGSPDEEGSLKWRGPGDSRDVPLPPLLVRILREHIDRFGVAGTDHVVCDEDGRRLKAANINAIWHQVRAAVFGGSEDTKRFVTLKIGELRHTRATLLLAARVPQLIVATWLGHSVVVLNTMYAGVIATGTSGFADEIARYRDELVPPEYQPGTGGQISVPEEALTQAIAQALRTLGLDSLRAGLQGLLGPADVAIASGQ